MAGFFDSIGRLDENDPTLQNYSLEDSRQGKVLDELYPSEFSSQSERTMHLPSASQQRDALNSGLVRIGNSDKFTTPSMMLAGAKDQDTKARMGQMESEYKRIRSSAGFRIADTLADTGRAFLSPLFWLGGEDTTRYDPSAKLEAGYRQQFAAAESMRSAVYTAATNQRQTRAAYLEQLNQNRVTNDLNERKFGLSQMQTGTAALSAATAAQSAGLTDTDKKFKNWTDLTYGQGSYESLKQDTELFRQTFEDYNVNVTGDMLRVQPVGDQTPVVMASKTYDEVEKIAGGYKSDPFREAIAKHRQLVEALDINNPAGDIAAVFSFMKALDPTSVVRESEYQVVAGAGGIMDKIRQIEEKFSTGNFLPPAVKESLRAYADQLMEINMMTFDAGRASALNKIGRFGVTDENGLAQRFIGGDVFSEFRPETPQAPTPIGTTDDGVDYFEDGLGKYILNSDGSKVYGDIQ